MTQEKEHYEIIYCHGIWCSNEQVTEKDNYMPQIDSVQAMKMKPSWNEEDYDADGMRRAMENATPDELSMYTRKTEKKIKEQYKKYADEVSTTN